MSFVANTVFEVRTTGNDTNGGGFVTGDPGTDFSQQNAKNTVGNNISTVDAVTNNTTTVTSATAAFTAAIVGNIILLSGTGTTTGWYYVQTFTSATSIVVDRLTGSTGGTGVSMNIGGALLSPGVANAIANIAGNTVFIKAGTYSITSATVNVAGGCIANPAGFIQGYTSTRSVGNTDVAPVLQLAVAGATLFSANNTGVILNIVCDGNGQTTAKASGGNGAVFVGCVFKNFNTPTTGTGPMFINCSATLNSAVMFPGNSFSCEAYANTATPFAPSQNNSCIDCIASGNTGATTDGFSLGGNTTIVKNCLSVSNARHGFVATSGSPPNALLNCHAESNGGSGFSIANHVKLLLNCSYFGNGTNVNLSGVEANVGAMAASASVFINAAGQVFSLNNTAGAGALLRAASYPTLFPRGLTANYRDIGAAQHADSGGASGPFSLVIATTISPL